MSWVLRDWHWLLVFIIGACGGLAVGLVELGVREIKDRRYMRPHKKETKSE